MSNTGAKLLLIGPCYMGRRNLGRDPLDFNRAFDIAASTAIRNEVDAVIQSGTLFGTRTPKKSSIHSLKSTLFQLRSSDIPVYHTPSERDADMDITYELSETGLLNILDDDPDIIKDIALFGVDPNKNIREQVSNLSVPEEASKSMLVLDTPVDPPIDSSNSRSLNYVERAFEGNVVTAANKYESAEYHDEIEAISPGPVEPIMSKDVFSDGNPYPASVAQVEFLQEGTETTWCDIEHRPLSVIKLRVDEGIDAKRIWEDLPNHEFRDSTVLLKVLSRGSISVTEELSEMLENEGGASSVKTWEYNGNVPDDDYKLDLEVYNEDSLLTQTRTSSDQTSETDSSEAALEDVPGIGESRSEELKPAGYKSATDIAAASVNELGEVEGISFETAKCIRETARELCGYEDTMAADLAERFDVDRRTVASAYATLAPSGVTPKEARTTLNLLFRKSDEMSVLHLDECSLRYRHFIFQAGFETLEDIVRSDVEELTQARYMGSNRAEKIQEAAKEKLGTISKGKSDEKVDEDGTQPPSSGKLEGEVSFFHDKKGYGFIGQDSIPEADEDIFFHMEDLGGPDVRGGEKLLFEIEETENGLRAKNIERV